MILIAQEGLDKSGKWTQTELLVKHLKTQGYKVVKSEFPRYDTPTGRLIRDWLMGKWNVDQATIELVLAADRQAQQAWFAQLERNKVDYLVLDRYTLSQRAYAIATGSAPEWINVLQQNMRKPDIEILIDIPAEESFRRKGKHGHNDRYEKDLGLQARVRDIYLKEAGIQINGMQSVENVHQDIIQAIQHTYMN